MFFWSYGFLQRTNVRRWREIWLRVQEYPGAPHCTDNGVRTTEMDGTSTVTTAPLSGSRQVRDTTAE
jgi:hypothetical protein